MRLYGPFYAFKCLDLPVLCVRVPHRMGVCSCSPHGIAKITRAYNINIIEFHLIRRFIIGNSVLRCAHGPAARRNVPAYFEESIAEKA